jgi:hypothetical protein
MKPDLSFLSKIRTSLENLWGGAQAKTKPLKVTKVPDVNDKQAMATESAQRFGVPNAEPTPYPRITADEILAGLARRANGGQIPPIAQAAQQLADLGNSLPTNIDPFFPTALALRESGGGVTSGVQENNPFGLMTWDEQGNRSLAPYPDFQTAVIGGGPNNQRGLKGVLNSGIYNDFLNSGNLSDFFNTYSPSGENASVDDQIALFRELLNYFRQ